VYICEDPRPIGFGTRINADIIVEDKVIIEIKAKKNLIPQDEAQLLNYLKATDKEVGLLVNFGPKPEFSRKVLDNNKK